MDEPEDVEYDENNPPEVRLCHLTELQDDIQRVINHWMQETPRRVTNAEVIGVLEMLKMDYWKMAVDEAEGE